MTSASAHHHHSLTETGAEVVACPLEEALTEVVAGEGRAGGVVEVGL
jgi:hypothetical protein